jgi:hypothetical protein
MLICSPHQLTNHYLMASQDALSLLYNDVRTVENFATASAFRLLAEPEYDFLASHDPVTRQKIRQQVIALVFATNLTDQFYFMGSFCFSSSYFFAIIVMMFDCFRIGQQNVTDTGCHPRCSCERATCRHDAGSCACSLSVVSIPQVG